MFELYPLLLIIFFATGISWLTVLYSLAYMRWYGVTQQVVTFTGFASAVGVWALFAMVQLTATTYETTMLAYKLLHVGAWGTPIGLLLYAFTLGPAKKWVNRTTAGVLALSVLPLFVLLFAAPTRYLFIDPTLQTVGAFSIIDHGNRPVYLAYLGWTYLLDVIALGYIGYQTVTDETIARNQTVIVIVSVLIPVFISVGQTLELPGMDTPGTIVTPLSLSLGMAGIGYATFRYDTFDAKSRARSRIIEEMQEGYLLVGPDGKILDHNTTASEILDETAPLTGTGVERVLPNYRPHEPTGESAATTFETRLGDGETAMTIETSASRLVRNGQPIGTLCVFRDITERKQYQQELQDQRDSLELLNAVVRHDIRNDLQTVLSYAEILAYNGHVTDDGQAHVEKIQTNTDNAIELTTKARELAAVMLQNDADLTAVNLSRVLTETIEEVDSAFETAHFTTDRPQTEYRVRADDMLSAVFRNLLKNAVQHNDKPDPRITLTVRARAETVRVVIEDNGPGIPDGQKEVVFGEGDAGLDSDGTGLGLHLVQSLVDKYGGSIWIEDRDPEGTRFVTELPRCDATD